MDHREYSLIFLAFLLVFLEIHVSSPWVYSEQDYHLSEKGINDAELKVAEAIPLQGEIKLDGILNEPAWQSAPVITGFRQRDPLEGEPATQRTDIRILFSPQTLYIGVTCHDQEPDQIVARFMQRDSTVFRDDSIHIMLDPFHNGQTAFMFSTNVLGARYDATVDGFQRTSSRSLQRRRQRAYPRRDWNGVWNVKTHHDNQGWTAEFALPFATFKFPPTNHHAWGINFRRIIPRNKEESIWTAYPRDLGFYALSHMGELRGLENLEQGIGLDVKPYTLNKFNIERDEFNDEDLLNQEGLDVSYSLTSNIQMDLTINPDFAETEVDEQPLNLTRFPLFFPEKRRFFLEGSSVFQFGTFSAGFPFHSRSIGLDEDRQPVPILFGSKVTGTAGGTNFGLLSAMTADNKTSPQTIYNVGRVQQRLFEESNIGAIITSKVPDGGNSNTVVGLDGSFITNIFDDKRFRTDFFAMQSITDGRDGNDFAGNVIFSYPNDPWDISLEYRHIGPDFNPELGFVRVKGIDRWDADLNYFNDINNGLIRRTVHGVQNRYSIDEKGNPFRASYELIPIGVVFESGDYVQYSFEYNDENVKEAFDIFGGTEIGPGRYHSYNHQISMKSSDSRPVRLELAAQDGTDFNGRFNSYETEFTLQLSRNFQFSFEGEIDERKYPLTPAPGGDFFGGGFTANLLRARVTYTFSPDLFVTSFLQWENESELASLNNRLHWTIEPERDLFVVVNIAANRAESRFLQADTAFKLGYLWRF